MRKIAIVGPESSGKTTLAQALAAHYGAPWVPDPSRTWLEQHGPTYTEADLVRIARYHVELEQEALRVARGARFLFIDTDLLNYRIWSQVKYGRVDPEIDRIVREVHYDLRLLCRPDIPWEPDPLRENPQDRERLFMIWSGELRTCGHPFVTLQGDHGARMDAAVDSINGR
ncbi:MAG: ATP-binding protein [Flavobacteriales bacterium]|nr:ATP-binding protein [Flavobacteriales bacterium]